MFRSLFWYTKAAVSLFSSRKPLKKAEQFLLTDNRTEGDTFSTSYVKQWAKDRVADSGSTINIKGLENIPDQNGILFMSNHQSNFDILLLLAELPVQHGFVAKVELDHIPFFSRWMRCIHCLFMDRNDMKQSAQTIIDGIKQLKSGINMVIFPEGTRSKGAPVGEFKAGSFKLATKSKAPIVPVTIDGTYKVMEGNKNKIKPAEINLIIHEPIYTDKLTKDGFPVFGSNGQIGYYTSYMYETVFATFLLFIYYFSIIYQMQIH